MRCSWQVVFWSYRCLTSGSPVRSRRYSLQLCHSDSYTDGGVNDGGLLAPPVVIPPDAGASRRSTNAKIWIENIADDIGATFTDYARSGACTDLDLWAYTAGQSRCCHNI
ncbi:hypothetical protein A0H81_02964 [Grifola frondosa]|uniref:Uncharacterized protein n=1 Tax=Grifola frondosa TaxID=5627 RepID=A0A1C7MIP1_GRIFR|nr:hypothetical protein A0H81_02964 [Grifola frondosa]